MWKPMFNVIVAFPIESAYAQPAREALAWGAMHIHGEPFFVPFQGHECEVRTYQFTSESARQRFRKRVDAALKCDAVLVMENEDARKWVPDPLPQHGAT